ncbi:hypothetical protein CLAIMM_05210 [Cladophialophora immunda]|nr:hypothetical protein CLAIMM_05210 [Cladophialophora immunda]
MPIASKPAEVPVEQWPRALNPKLQELCPGLQWPAAASATIKLGTIRRVQCPLRPPQLEAKGAKAPPHPSLLIGTPRAQAVFARLAALHDDLMLSDRMLLGCGIDIERRHY